MAISDLITVSRIEGRADVETGSVRQWRCRLFECIFTSDDTKVKEVEIGYARVFTAPATDFESLDDCDSISGDLEAVMAALWEIEEAEFCGPLLIIDLLHVNSKYRGRGLATLVAEAAIQWFDGLVNFVALAVTRKPKFRPAAAQVVEKLGFRQFKDDVWVREL